MDETKIKHNYLLESLPPAQEYRWPRSVDRHNFLQLPQGRNYNALNHKVTRIGSSSRSSSMMMMMMMKMAIVVLASSLVVLLSLLLLTSHSQIVSSSLLLSPVSWQFLGKSASPAADEPSSILFFTSDNADDQRDYYSEASSLLSPKRSRPSSSGEAFSNNAAERNKKRFGFSSADNKRQQQSPYNKGLHDEHCHPWRDDKINIHIIAHSHDDVGWLKTVDQYFWGDRNDIQNAGVQYIIDGVVQALAANPDRRYVQVEMAFLARWWHRQNNITKDTFRRLLRNGQLEIVCAGWSMPDEATTDYVALIDQHTLGFSFINTEIDPDYRPLIGWQIDPFGHSKEAASLFAEMGMNGLYFARLDYQDREVRQRNKTAEMVWKLRPSTPDVDLSLFTGAMARSTYCPPAGFNFDIFSNDPPIMDDPRLEGYNAEERAGLFNFLMRAQQLQYPTNQLMVTMGCDFNYGSASSWFMNLDALIRVVNNMTGLNAFYSNPSCYTRAVHESVKSPLATKTDDFFPYADGPASFWTGYFTSRPSVKRLVRELVASYGTTRQIMALSHLPMDASLKQQLEYMQDTVGIMQHHDAVSGTSKQDVTDDARKRCSTSLEIGREIFAKAFVATHCGHTAFIKHDPSSSAAPKASSDECLLRSTDIQFCPLLNESFCPFSENNTAFSVILYNRIAENITSWVRLPINWPGNENNELVVTDASGNSVAVDVVPVLDSDIGTIPTRENSTANAEAIFKASMPPLGSSVYFVQRKQQASSYIERKDQIAVTSNPNDRATGDGQSFDNGVIKLTLDQRGHISQLENLVDGVKVSLRHSLAYYTTVLPPAPTSGAYRFTPDELDLHRFRRDASSTFVVQGSQVVEIHSVHSPWAKSIYRLYKNEPFVELQWIVGPIPVSIEDTTKPSIQQELTVGREVVSLFESSIKSDGVFYTDANGREMLQRKRDYRPSWNLTSTQNVSQNYYPIVSRISTKDDNAQLTVITDRAQGASGFRPGSLELLVHRRLTYDDNFGVGEPLMETENGQGLVATGRMLLMLNSPKNASRFYRKASQCAMFPHTVAFAPIRSFADGSQQHHPKLVTSSQEAAPLLPSNINLLTVDNNFPGCTLLVRLEHMFEAAEDDIFSADTKVSLSDLISVLLGHGIDPNKVNIQETALGANMPIADSVRLQWKTRNDEIDENRVRNTEQTVIENLHQSEFEHNAKNGDWKTIVMRPMQIRTFCITVDSR